MLLTRRDSVMGETTPRRTRRPKQPRIPGDFAALVRGLRESRGMTQQEMGELLGFPAKDAQSNYGNRSQRRQPMHVDQLALGIGRALRALHLGDAMRLVDVAQ